MKVEPKMNNLLLRKRGGFDELYTPAYGVRPLLEYIKPNSVILAPFDDKSSNYYKVFTEVGHKVITSHQWDGKDFFDYTKEELKALGIDYIISNPPYSSKDKVLEKLYELGKPFAMLLPIATMEGIKRGQMFSDYGIEILVLNTRINFMEGQGKSSYFNTSYFCKGILHKELVFHKLNKKEIDND